MCKSSVELGLVYKTFVNKTLEKLRCCPGKTNYIHCSRNAGCFGKLNKVIFPSQPKTHFFRDILPERVSCSDEARWWARSRLTLVDVCTDAFFREKCPYKEFHPRLRQQEPWLKKSLWNLYEPRRKIFATEILCHTSKSFFETLSILSMWIQLFNSVNNSECMKQHCTPL